jgi:hypothetical protein
MENGEHVASSENELWAPLVSFPETCFWGRNLDKAPARIQKFSIKKSTVFRTERSKKKFTEIWTQKILKILNIQ